MNVITILGLGPGALHHLTREAWAVLESADEIWLRTEHHPTVAELPSNLTVHSFDNLYEKADNFSEVYEAIAAEILSLGQRPQGVIYAVPGHPFVGEATVKLILTSAEKFDLEVRIVEGMSFVTPTLASLGIDALEGLQIQDAIELALLHHPLLNSDLPALVGQLYGRDLATDVKLTLMNQYPDDHEVVLVHAAGSPDQRIVRLPLYELDHQRNIAHLTTLYVPPLPGVSSFEGLQETVAHLRAPDGCPWDREQTHASLRSALLEEAYETVSAIDLDDVSALREELGDLLLQVLLHTQIATEAGEFQMAQVISGIDVKLKHRHPHVWGDQAVKGSNEVLLHWEELKREERGEGSSALDGVPDALPALQQADTYSRRAARVGFDWSEVGGVVEKVHEEIGELKSAISPEEKEAELGDLLFAIVNWARWLGLDAETALRKANARFAHRFRHMEQAALEQGRDMRKLTEDELEALWWSAKIKAG